MSFCTRLRRRRSCANLISVITSPQGLSLRENELRTHDLAMPMKSSSPNPNATRQLRVIILTPSSTSAENMPTTLARLEHFASLTGAVDVAVVFHLTPEQSSTSMIQTTGPSAFSALTSTLFTQTGIPYFPILPLTKAASLPEVLQTFNNSLIRSKSAAVAVRPAIRTLELLPHCTTDSPLDRHSTLVLTDVFDSLQGLAGAMTDRSQDGELVQRMANLLGLDTAESVAAFWRDEWVAD